MRTTYLFCLCLVPEIQKYLCIHKYAVRTHARSLLRNSSIVAASCSSSSTSASSSSTSSSSYSRVYPAPCFASGFHLIFRASTQLKCLFSFTSVRKNCYFQPRPPYPAPICPFSSTPPSSCLMICTCRCYMAICAVARFGTLIALDHLLTL